MKKLIPVVVMLSVLLSLIGCAGKPKMVGDETILSGQEMPKWVGDPNRESDKDFKAYVGTSRNFTTMQEARNDARMAAYEQALEALGTYGKRRVSRVLAAAGVVDDIINSGMADEAVGSFESMGILRPDVAEWHDQQVQRQEQGRVRNYFRSFCLVRVSRNAPQEFAEQLLEERWQQAKEEADRRNMERAIELNRQMNNEGELEANY